MIRTFACKETEKIFNQEYSKKFPAQVNKVGLRKLILIDNAETLVDLKAPPGNMLEALKGDRQGQHSIRINSKYRICFVEKEGDFYNVEIVDYH